MEKEEFLKLLPKLIKENDEVKGAIISALSGVVATKNDIERLMEHSDRRFDTLINETDKRFEAMDKRFEAMDKRFEAMDKRFEAMDKRFESMQKTMNQRFEAMDKRFEMIINQMEKRAEIVDRRFEEAIRDRGDIKKDIKKLTVAIG